jgi:hypothetical protein
VNSESSFRTQVLAVELAEFKTPGAMSADCGGPTPNYDASNIFRSLLINGRNAGCFLSPRSDTRLQVLTEAGWRMHVLATALYLGYKSAQAERTQLYSSWF